MGQKQVKAKRRREREAKRARLDADWLPLMRARGWPEVDRATFLAGLGMLNPVALAMDAHELVERLMPDPEWDHIDMDAPLPPASSRATAAHPKTTTIRQLDALMKQVYTGPVMAAISDDDYTFFASDDDEPPAATEGARTITFRHAHKLPPSGPVLCQHGNPFTECTDERCTLRLSRLMVGV